MGIDSMEGMRGELEERTLQWERAGNLRVARGVLGAFLAILAGFVVLSEGWIARLPVGGVEAVRREVEG